MTTTMIINKRHKDYELAIVIAIVVVVINLLLIMVFICGINHGSF